MPPSASITLDWPRQFKAWPCLTLILVMSGILDRGKRLLQRPLEAWTKRCSSSCSTKGCLPNFTTRILPCQIQYFTVAVATRQTTPTSSSVRSSIGLALRGASAVCICGSPSGFATRFVVNNRQGRGGAILLA
jgi:hypothetical protein